MSEVIQFAADVTYPPLPFEVEAEQAALGGCFADNLQIPQVEAACQSNDFFEPLHRRIAAAIYAIDRERRPVTPLTVKAWLGNDAGLADVGGHAYLATIAAAGAGTDAAANARIVANTAARRAAMIAIWDAQAALSRGNPSIVDVLRPVVEAADRAADRDSLAGGSQRAGDTAYEFLRTLEQPEKDRGVTTGLRGLDDILGGMYPGNLYIIAGRPGMGKSAVGVSISRCAARANASVEYYSLEMPRQQIAARFVADLDFDRRDRDQFPLQYSRLLRRRASSGELERAAQAADSLKSLPITIHDRDSMTMADIAGLARARAARIKDRGVVIVDHLHLIRPDDRYRGNQTQELGEVAKAAKRLARAIEWPVVLLAQINRQVEARPEKERMPTLSDLRQSGEIEEAADAVLFLHRPAYYVERKRPPAGSIDPKWGEWLEEMEPVRHTLNIDIAKHRNGETGSIRVFVDIGANAIRDTEQG